MNSRIIAKVSLAAAMLLTSVARVDAQVASDNVFYIPYPEDEVLSTLTSINTDTDGTACTTSPADPITTLIGISVLIDGTIITVDHSEPTGAVSGFEYEADIDNPVQASTEIWGDGILTNGVAPGVAGDILDAGTYIEINNDITSTTQDLGGGTLPYDYDAADKFGSSLPVSVTRIAWATNSETLFAGGFEVFDTTQLGTSYTFPVGENSPSAGAASSEFGYVGASIMATVDGTQVSVDLNGDGDFTDPGEVQNQVVNEGQTFFIDGGIQEGGTVTATDDVQVDFVVGTICGNYRARFFTLFPTERWSDSYYTPVDQPSTDTAETEVWLHNPGNAAITVQVRRADGSGGINTSDTVNVPAGTTVLYNMPENTGANFSSPGNNFYAISNVGIAHDWGFALLPENVLSQQVFVGTGLGRDPQSTTNPNENGSPVWLSAARLDNAVADGTIQVCVDFNNDGNGGGGGTFNGREFDIQLQFEAYENARVFDPDGDQSSLFAFICDNDTDGDFAVLVAAWGEDPDTASTGQPGLDLGTGVPNVRSLFTAKTSVFSEDINNDGLANVGDLITYTIDVTNNGFVPIQALGLKIEDLLPPELQYVPGSTLFSDDDITNAPVDDDVVPTDGSTVFPLDAIDGQLDDGILISEIVGSGPIQNGETVQFTYDARVIAVPFDPDQICNEASSFSGSEENTDEECLNPGSTSISGSVQSDDDGDGTGDSALQGVIVQLYTDTDRDGQPDTLVATTSTAADGSYIFDNIDTNPIANGGTGLDYVVVEIDPAGFESVADNDATPGDEFVAPQTPTDLANSSQIDNIIPVSVIQGEADADNDFVDGQLGLISGQVWLDEDQDGINDIEEAGLTNVTVELTDGVCTAGVDCPTVLTDQFGNYVFDDLPPGNYSVSVIDGLPADVSPTAGPFNPQTRPVTLPAGGEVVDQDFGYIADLNAGGIIGDRVWSDADGDGIQDAGEAGLEGVTLTLLDSGGNTVGTTTTNEDGDYLFTGVPLNDEYTVVVDASNTNAGNSLDGFSPTQGPQSEGGFVSSPVTLNNALTTVTDVDFGFDSPNTLTITDRVWYDADGDQTQDPGEPGIEGVSIELLDSAGNVVATTVTDENGDFTFAGVPDADDYQIVISDRDDELDGLTETTTTGGSATISGPLSTAAGDDTLNTIGDDGTPTFGFNNPGSIAGTVYSDGNDDRDQNGGDPGIAGVVVTLDPPAGVDLGNGDGNPITTTTAPDGSYLFDGLPPGDYVVTIEAGDRPAGDNTEDPDSPANADGNNNSGTITLGLGEGVVEQDFGYFDVAKNDLSGTVFLDTDKDGIQEIAGADGILGTSDDEPGFDAVTLELIDCGAGTCDDGDEAVIATTTSADGTTDANGDGNVDELDLGFYEFPGLEDGNYQVAVTDEQGLLSGYDITSGLDVQEATIAGADVEDVDFGYVKDEATGSIAGEVFLDENTNGLAETTEANFAGVDVYLCNSPVANEPCDPTDSEFITVTTTDANGEYAFTGLPAGNYLVDVEPTDVPGGLNNTVDPAAVALSEGERVDEVDFGYVPDAGNGLISGTTWIDANNNGVFDSGEAPLPGVTVEVLDPNSATPGTPIASIVTGSDGYWELPLSGATLVDDLIVRYVEATVDPALDGSQPTNLPNGIVQYSADDVDVASDPDRFIGDLNFGFPPNGTLGAITGTIYSDVDQNGDYLAATDGEFEGVTINLLDSSNNVIATTTTDENGFYSFTGLLDDSYRVIVTDNENVLQDLNVNEQITLPIVISGGNTVTDQDQGYITETTGTLASIGSLVFIDLDQDGFADDGEPRVPGVTVQCWLDNDESATVADPFVAVPAGDPEAGVDNLVRTVTTDENGEYYCTNLPEGQYIVRVTDVNGVLAGYPDTSPNNAANNVADNFAKPFTYAVDLAAGTPDLTADFGVEAQSSLSGTVYFDDDANGDFEPPAGGTDSPLGGIEVEACDVNNVCISVFTEADGTYTIPVGPGDWTVTVLTPPDGTSALEVPANPTTVGINEDITDIDFGFVDAGVDKRGSITGQVSEDTTGDGLGDTAIPGVVVQLYSDPNGDGNPEDGELLATQITNGSGDYAFTDLVLITNTTDFVVVEVDPAGFASVSDTQSVEGGAEADSAGNANTNDNLIPVTLAINETDANNDFVDVRPGSIAGTVWLDEDQDGINDIEEAGLTGILVELVDDGGNVVATTVTDQNGNYSFPDVAPGDYTVNVDDTSLPDNLQATAGPNGIDPRPVSVAVGESVEDVDFGYIADPDTGAIGDRVWNDANGNGVQDPGEPGIEGVTLTLLDSNGDPVGAPVVTGPDGDYLFTNIPFGDDYTVNIAPTDSQLTGFSPTQGPQSEGGFVSNPVTLDSALTTVTDIDFGFDSPNATATLTDTVWFDSNNDGVFDADEEPIPGVTVNLIRTDGAGVPVDADNDGQADVIATAVTDANGDVSFTGLPADNYALQLTDNNGEVLGLNSTTPEADARASDFVALPQGGSDDQDSFGFNNFGLIEGTVFSDANGVNGQDPGEPGLGGITVTLSEDTNGDGTFDTVVATVVTEPDGTYSFDGLPPGDYQVVVTPPVGTQTEDPDVALDDTTDITLGIGESSVGNDFGYQNPALADISGTVFLDTDKDGVEELNGNDGLLGTPDDEPGFEGVTVELVDCGAGSCNDGDEEVIATTTSDSNGNYTFPDLPDGNYEVAVTDESALLAGYDITSGLDTLPVTLAGVDQDDVDFGYIKDEATGSISGEVFIDETVINGLADDSDPNLSGVEVYLCLAADAPCTDANAIATTVTDANGEYVFDDLPAGEYVVDADARPAGSGGTVPDGLTLTVDPTPVALSEGEDVTDVDVGYQPDANSGVLSGFVWTDVDRDGQYDAAEAPIGGVDIIVYDINGVEIARGTTGADGNWIVAGISGADLQNGYIITYDDADIPAALVSSQPSNLPLGDDVYTPVNLLDDVNNDDGVISFLDFAFPPNAVGGDLGSIAGTIYSDSNQDDDYVPADDGELQGVTINLVNCGAGTCDDGDEVVQSTTQTDSQGNYVFDGLVDGDYQVVITDRDDVLQDLNPNGDILHTGDNDAGTAPQPQPGVIRIAGAEDVTDIDGGYVSDPALGSIGNRFWFDTNGDGEINDNEPGVEGVTIQVWLDNNQNAIPDDPSVASNAATQQPEPGIDNLVRTVTTDENGEFYLTSLPAGQYIVVVQDANGFDEGADATNAPNAATLNGRNPNEDGFAKPWVYALTKVDGTPNFAADFGVTGSNSIAGNVFIEDEDLIEPDGNGVIDPRDPGFPADDTLFPGELDGTQGGISPDAPAEGVEVVLYIEQPDGTFDEIQRTTTDSNGDYSFGGLPDGNYRVEVLTGGSVIDGFGQTGDPDIAGDSNPENRVCDSATAALCDDTHTLSLAGDDVTGIDFGYQKNFATTPVTINMFSSAAEGNSVTFTWETSNEVGHVGYQLYARTAETWVLLNDELIAHSDGGDALQTRTYSYTVEGVDATWFALVDVSAAEELDVHGPYRLGQTYGDEIEESAEFDWSTIQLKGPDTSAAQRATQSRVDRLRALESSSDYDDDLDEEEDLPEFDDEEGGL